MLKKIIFAFVVVITVGIFGRTFWAYEKVKEGQSKEISTSVIQSVSTSTGQQEINASMIAPTSTQKLHTINTQQNSLKTEIGLGYYKQDGKIYFSSYVGGPVSEVAGADPSTFTQATGSLGDTGNYFKDKTSIYYFGNKVNNADLISFVPLQNGYAKDKNYVYFGGKKIIGVDASTFAFLGDWYSKDKNSVQYYDSGIFIKLTDADPSSFVILGYNYTKDKSSAYFMGFKMEPVDIDTFNIREGHYAQDRFSVYYKGVRIVGANPATFVELTYPYSKDRTAVYSGGVKILNADPATFVVPTQ